MQNVTVYTTPTCVYCNMTKSFFKEHNIRYEEKDVTDDVVAREQMIAKSKQMGVPVIDIGGHIIIGFDQEGLSKLLDIK